VFVKNSEGQADQQAAPLGPLEFAILGGLAILIVLAFSALFGEDVQSWIAEFGEDRTPPQAAVTVVETGGIQEPLEQEVIAVDNCDQDEDTVEEVLRSRQFIPVFQFEDELDPEAVEALARQLEAYYGFQQGQQVERRFNLQLTAAAGSLAEYTLEWQQVWTEGVLQVTWQDGSEDQFDYNALTDIEFRTVNISQAACP
jgi:hypothetical protein